MAFASPSVRVWAAHAAASTASRASSAARCKSRPLVAKVATKPNVKSRKLHVEATPPQKSAAEATLVPTASTTEDLDTTVSDDASLKSAEADGQLSELEKRAALVNQNYALVAYFARRMASNYEEYNDLFQEGCLGLMRAAEKYEPAKNPKFGSYATMWIISQMQRFKWKQKAVRVPHQVHEVARKLQDISTRMTKELGRGPSDDELAAEMKLTPSMVRRAREAFRSMHGHLSLDALLSDESSTSHLDQLEDPSLKNDQLEAVEEINKMVKSELSARERGVLEAQFELSNHPRRTRKELANEWNVSEVAVTNSKKKALSKLRRKADDLSPYLSVL